MYRRKEQAELKALAAKGMFLTVPAEDRADFQLVPRDQWAERASRSKLVVVIARFRVEPAILDGMRSKQS